MKITIQNKGAESAPVTIDTNDKSSEATGLGTVIRASSAIGSPLSGAIVTAINKVFSFGTFNTMAEVEKAIAAKLDAKVSGKEYPTLDEVKKANPRLKDGFLNWYFNGMQVGDKISKASSVKLTTINNVPVAIMKMKWGRNTMDMSGLAKQQLLLVTAFIKAGGSIKGVKIGKCYINGKDDIATRESFIIGYDDKEYVVPEF